MLRREEIDERQFILMMQIGRSGWRSLDQCVSVLTGVAMLGYRWITTMK